MRLVLVAAIKAAIITVVTYTVILPHMYILFSNVSSSTTTLLLDKYHTLPLYPTELDNQIIITDSPTTKFENSKSHHEKEEIDNARFI